MPARSKSQQRLFGMVHAYQKGKLKNAPEEVRNIARSISDEDAEHFAKTKHKGLPEKKAYQYHKRRSEMTHKKAYERGFMDKCAEFGVDPESLVKAAGKLPPWFIQGWKDAVEGVKKSKEVFTPEQMRTIGNMYRQSRKGLSQLRAKAYQDSAAYIREHFPILGKGEALTPETMLAQGKTLLEAEALPSVHKFYTKSMLSRLFEQASKGNGYPTITMGTWRDAARIGTHSRRPYLRRVVGRKLGEIQQTMQSATPSEMDAFLRHFKNWMGRQPTTQEQAAKRLSMPFSRTARKARPAKKTAPSSRSKPVVQSSQATE